MDKSRMNSELKKKNCEVFDVECSTICSRNMDSDESRCLMVGHF